MQFLIIVIAAVVGMVMVAGIAQNMRTIEYLAKQQEAIAGVVSANKRSVDAEIKKTKEGINAAIEVYDSNFKSVDDDIAEIIRRMDSCAEGIGKLDEMETRLRQTSAKASEALRCIVLNDMEENKDE